MTVEEGAAAAIAAVPGDTDLSETPVLVTVTGPATPVIVALDPYTGEVLRLTPEGQTWDA